MISNKKTGEMKVKTNKFSSVGITENSSTCSINLEIVNTILEKIQIAIGKKLTKHSKIKKLNKNYKCLFSQDGHCQKPISKTWHPIVDSYNH